MTQPKPKAVVAPAILQRALDAIPLVWETGVIVDVLPGGATVAVADTTYTDIRWLTLGGYVPTIGETVEMLAPLGQRLILGPTGP